MSKKKYILITGVSTGIGLTAVKYLLNLGYYVIGSVRSDKDQIKLETLFLENFCCLKFDVTKKDEIEVAYTLLKSKFNDLELTALVNNAGLSSGGPMALISDDDFRKQIEVNLFGVRNVTNVFLPLLGAKEGFKGKPGKIINISSLAGVFNTPFNGVYCVSKHAVESLGEIYRRELMLYGIDVVSIQAGPIASEIWVKNIGGMDRYKSTPYGKFTTKADEILREAQKRALPAETIAKLIAKIILTKKPKVAYMVNKNMLFTKLLIHYLPARVVDRLLWKKLNE